MKIGQYVDEFVARQRALGFKYRVQSSLLKNYAAFAQQRGERFVAVDTVLEWSQEAPSAIQTRNRLLTVRRFALSANADNPRHQIPPADAFGGVTYRRRRPHIYTSEERRTLRKCALSMTPSDSVRPITFDTLITLLWVSGLRISEALRLDIDDITSDGLVIRATKFRKDRLVAIHSSTYSALDRYLASHSRMRVAKGNAVFVSTWGTRLAYSTAVSGFLEIIRSAGLRGCAGQPGPCLHDFRHSFAVRSLEKCPACAQSVQKHMIGLSTYLGHAHITDTYWYLEATPRLTRQIANITETCWNSEVLK